MRVLRSWRAEDAGLGVIGRLVRGPIAFRLLVHHLAPRLGADFGLAGGQQAGGDEKSGQRQCAAAPHRDRYCHQIRRALQS